MSELYEKTEHELQALFLETQRLLKEKSESRRQTALSQMTEICHNAELTVYDLRAFVKAYVAKPVVVADGAKCYVNPTKNSETWDGQGRQPRFVRAALKAGKTLEDLELKAEPQSEQQS